MLTLLITRSVFCSNTTIQNLKIKVSSNSIITTSGSPPPLSITLNKDGTGSSQDSTTTYSISSNTRNTSSLKITGALTQGGNLPKNLTLKIKLNSCKGTSLGARCLSTQPVDLVAMLPSLVSETATITYIFSVINGWTIPAQTLNRTVTLTLTSNS